VYGPALLTFYIPSSALILCCTAILIYAACFSYKRQLVTLPQGQPYLEQTDTTLQLLSRHYPSSPNEDPGISPSVTRDRRLIVLAAILVLGVLSWVFGAATVSLERKTVAETVVATFYAICTTTVGLMLVFAQQPTLNHFRDCWKSLSSGRRNLSERWRAENVDGGHKASLKQVVYSIGNSAQTSCHVCRPTVTQAEDVADFMSEFDDQEMTGVGRRDCTGSSCSIPASLSDTRLPVSSGKCGECRLCRSNTDSDTRDWCLSRNSVTRMKDFDHELSWSSGEENHQNLCVEGGWWNGEVDVDGCSIHRAPCPSPASACSLKNDLELAERSESSLKPRVVVLRWIVQY